MHFLKEIISYILIRMNTTCFQMERVFFCLFFAISVDAELMTVIRADLPPPLHKHTYTLDRYQLL